MIKRLKIFLLNEVIEKVKGVRLRFENCTNKIGNFESKLQNKIKSISNTKSNNEVEKVFVIDETNKPYEYDSSSLFDY